MGLQNIMTPLHCKTERDYFARMSYSKSEEMIIAKKFGVEYWDGERKFGYGGYHYDGRWRETAHKFIDRYKLTSTSKILDLGCGKAFLLYEIGKLLPGIEAVGLDLSQYAISKAPENIRSSLGLFDIREKLNFKNDEFDLTLSINLLHNFKLPSLISVLNEMDRVSKNAYLCVESYKDEAEMCHLQCWALTCESFFSPESWEWVFSHSKYSYDYEFVYFS